jgi:hypothetical protein
MIKVSNIKAVCNSDYNGPALEFDVGDTTCIEYLNDSNWAFDIEITDSALVSQTNFTDEEIAEIRGHLRAWLADSVEISVAVNGVPDFFGFTLPAKVDEEFIRGIIEAENIRIGGPDCNAIYDGHNGVSVDRDGEEMTSLRQEENPIRHAA